MCSVVSVKLQQTRSDVRRSFRPQDRCEILLPGRRARNPLDRVFVELAGSKLQVDLVVAGKIVDLQLNRIAVRSE
jgi:hypothetical protein